jgi:NitT/TauT family transport system substrate-binding protein
MSLTGRFASTASQLHVVVLVVALLLAACGDDTAQEAARATPSETVAQPTEQAQDDGTEAEATEATEEEGVAEGTEEDAADGPADPITIQFSWLPTPGFAPVFLADERGYFAEENLEVTISPGGGAVSAEQVLATGGADIAVGSVDNVPNARKEGIPLVSLAVIERYNTSGVIVREDSDIREPQDLAGRTITVKNFDVTGDLLPAYLQAVGVDPGSVTINAVDPQTQEPLFQAGRIEVATGFLRDEGSRIEIGTGTPIRTFSYYDAGIRFPSTGIFATEQALEEKPDLVRRAVRAILRGYADAAQDPRAAVEAAQAQYPEQYENMEVAEADAELFAANVREHLPEEGLGYQREEDWADAIALLVEYLGLEDPEPTSEYFTNDFLPEEPVSFGN